jgi:hypothetical protein
MFSRNKVHHDKPRRIPRKASTELNECLAPDIANSSPTVAVNRLLGRVTATKRIMTAFSIGKSLTPQSKERMIFQGLKGKESILGESPQQ